MRLVFSLLLRLSVAAMSCGAEKRNRLPENRQNVLSCSPSIPWSARKVGTLHQNTKPSKRFETKRARHEFLLLKDWRGSESFRCFALSELIARLPSSAPLGCALNESTT